MTHDELCKIALITHDADDVFGIRRNGILFSVCKTSAIAPEFVTLLASSHLMYQALDLQAQAMQALIELAESSGASHMVEHLKALQDAVMLAMRAAQVGSHEVANAIRGEELTSKRDAK